MTNKQQLSLSNRLLLVVSLVLTAFLGVSAFSLNNAFQASAENAQHKRLKNYIYTILTAADFDNDGSIHMPEQFAESEFSTPNSGLYAQITTGRDIVWQSQSSLGLFIALPDHPGPSNEYLSTIELQNGSKLLNLAYGIVWENDHGKQFAYTINVAEDLNAIYQQKAGFQRSLWYWLGGTGLMLLIAQAFILRWGLRPLYDVTIDLHAIESGDKSRLSDNYPKELCQLTQNINTLLDHEQSRRERYKNSLADLAHSLKTPLSVFRGELDSNVEIEALRQSGHEQLDRISAMVDYQLQRAATEGKSNLLAPVSLAEIIYKILGTLDKVYRAKGVQCQCDIEKDVYIHADKDDMYELLGNLLENAYKYCNSQTSIILQSLQNHIQIRIDDDGNGISEHAQEDILKRGKRMDTQVEGHGLGLAIASDIIEAYGGEISLQDSYLGGAKFVIQLPKD
ncbi:MAG: ATP-binding protein [Gammaproteobacteria bacterium]|nr:ATP-binding protein [Gammaproteobacteria bacterium]